MVETIKFFGVPGSGKTTRLIEELKTFVEGKTGDTYGWENRNGAEFHNVCFTTFSKAQATDAMKRIAQAYGIELKDLVYHHFGTIHHVCLQLLGWDIKNNNPKLEKPFDRYLFFKDNGIDYPQPQFISNKKSEDSIEPEMDINEIVLEENATDGEKIFAIFEACIHKTLPISDWRLLGIDYEEPIEGQIEELYNSWVDYKTKNDLVSFTDMLVEVLKEKMYPQIDALFVDEFQDLTPLLYSVIKMWSEHASSQVMIAGDDDQTIYVFSGAEPSFFLNFPGKEIVLNVSHRVPSNILSQADLLISQVNERKDKDLVSKYAGGSFSSWDKPTVSMILEAIPTDATKKTFFLFRTNWNMRKFADILVSHGIPYTKLREKSRLFCPWTGKAMTEKREVLLKLRDRIPLVNHDIRIMTGHGSDHNFLQTFDKSNGYVIRGMKKKINEFLLPDDNQPWSTDDLKKVFVRLPMWNNKDILGKDDNKNSAIMENMQENSFCRLDPRNIQIGTIHSAKGLEADVVFVFNNHTNRIQRDLENRPDSWDEEARLYYVGITRAKEQCYFITNFFKGESSFDTYCF